MNIVFVALYTVRHQFTRFMFIVNFSPQISHGIEQEYIPKDGMDIFVVSDDPEELVNKLRAKKASLVNSPKQ